MHQAISGILQRLLGAVKTDKPHYTLQELLDAGFPPFIVERIRLDLAEKINKQIVIPDTVDMDDPQVKQTWEAFQQSMQKKAKIKKGELEAVAGKVITEIVKVYLEPRQHMAEYIYRGEEELGLNELTARTNQLTIYKHFGRAIPLYMKKRKLETLDKKRCKLLIHKLDANLVSAYSAEDWAKMLEPLFILYGGEIDARLIQLFFEDKGLYLTAKAFNELNENITKTRFIEILSYPDLLNVELQEKFRDKFREELVSQKNRLDQPDEEEVIVDEKEHKLLDSFSSAYEDIQPDNDTDSFNALFKSETKGALLNEFEEPEETPKNTRKHDQTEVKQFRRNLASVLDRAASSYKSLSGEADEDEEEQEREAAASPREKPAEPEKKSEPAKPAEENINSPQDSESDDEAPQMWQQFLSPDQMDIMMGSSKQDEEIPVFIDEDDLIDEDAGEEEVQVAAPRNHDEDIRVYLMGDEVYFIEEIFEGSESQYENTLTELLEYKDWEKAANFIQKEVFSQHSIDMTSEVAIDFIDQLQAYFKKYKN